MNLNERVAPLSVKQEKIRDKGDDEAQLRLAFCNAYVAHELLSLVTKTKNTANQKKSWNEISKFLFGQSLDEITKDHIFGDTNDAVRD